jgi:hypothetical protein
LAGSATSYTIPGGTLKADLGGSTTEVDVSAINDAALSGAEWIGSSSLLRVIYSNESESFTTPDA